MKESIILEQDTLIVKDGSTFILFSPFTRKLTRIDSNPLGDHDLYQRLSERDFFSEPPQSTKPDYKWDSFKSIMLLLTRSCNLGCIYCYANAKPTGGSMTVALAIDAVDWFVANLDLDIIRITFHGGGEPSLEQPLIKKVVNHVNKIKGAKGLRFMITTNGTANKEFWEWIMEKRFGISISMDGPPDIQNKNRPFAVNRKGSSNVVEKSVKLLVKNKYPFTIRVTYSPVYDIKRIVRYFGDLGVSKIHLEPLFPFGREYNTVSFGKKNNDYDVYSPHGTELLKKFFIAIDIAKEYGIKIYNGHLINFTKGSGYFCGAASGRSMVVTHDGLLTGCVEVVDGFDEDIDTFVLGRYNKNLKTFEIDHNKIKLFQKRHADFLPACNNCYARYHCAGGCLVKTMRATGKFNGRDMPYCIFTKAIIPELVRRIAKQNNI